MKKIDAFLNNITMYRLLLSGLLGMVVLAFLFSLAGTIAYSPLSLLISFVLLVPLTYTFDYLGARLFSMSMNPESPAITGLILFFVLAPATSVTDALWLILGAAIAIKAKYLLAYRHKHIFNPAAFSMLVLTLLGSGMSLWWVASPAFFPALALFGFLIVRKLRRYDLWFSFIIAAALVKFGYEASTGVLAAGSLTSWLISWPTIFFSTIMLTEPLTMPPTRSERIVYGGFVGALFSLPLPLFSLSVTPQLALVLGNIFSFIVSPKGRTSLTLISSEKLSSSLVELTFKPERPFSYAAGQYAEWTLAHEVPDERGARRYFTLASAPSEEVVRLGIRTVEKPSSYKQHLLALAPGGQVSISNVSGDFTLPDDTAEKILCIAGGVGVTPFASMVREMRARGERRDLVLLYAASEPSDFGYGEVWQSAAALGVRVVRLAARADSTWTELTGTLDAPTLALAVPDVRERTVYISGPQAMVSYYKGLAHELGIGRGSIHTDYFPGL